MYSMNLPFFTIDYRQKMDKGSGLLEVKKISSGTGCFFTTVDGFRLHRVEVTAARVKVDAKREDLCVFVENRSFTKVKDYGCGSVVAIPLPENHYTLGVCIAVDLTSIAYLECPDMITLETIYSSNSFSNYLERTLTTKVLRLRTPNSRYESPPPKKPKVSENFKDVYWLNLVHCPTRMQNVRKRIKLDCCDPGDATISYSFPWSGRCFQRSSTEKKPSSQAST